jgi:hypothetical protein|tara:strand:- start:337 stop:1200 length:864 start_codon:yes stop_codon:yes gene_type:complete
MAATLSLDTITSSGSTITVPTGKTLAITDASALTVGGTAISAGSSNILRKTGDYTVLEADVSGKSELVIATNAAASTRTITLPAVATTGLANCIVTIVADDDATSTYKLMVEDSASAEVWTGYQTGDFVRLIVSNSAWVVVDHKETYYSYRYLTADLSFAASALTKLTGFTNVTEIGNAWDNGNNQLVTPTGMNGYWTIYFLMTAGTNDNGVTPRLYLNGSPISQAGIATDASAGGMGGHGISGMYYATSTQVVELYGWNLRSNSGHPIAGGDVEETHFVAKFDRVY